PVLDVVAIRIAALRIKLIGGLADAAMPLGGVDRSSDRLTDRRLCRGAALLLVDPWSASRAIARARVRRGFGWSGLAHGDLHGCGWGRSRPLRICCRAAWFGALQRALIPWDPQFFLISRCPSMFPGGRAHHVQANPGGSRWQRARRTSAH